MSIRTFGAAGAVVLNIPTLYWAFAVSPAVAALGAAVLACLGFALGGVTGWALQDEPAGSVHELAPAEDLPLAA